MKRRSSNRKNNIYLPIKGRIESIVPLTEDVNFYRIRSEKPLSYGVGQFFMVSVWGYGEVPISVCSLPEKPEILELSIRKVGFVTNAIHRLKEGDELWFRGPYGRAFPMELSINRDVILIAGGIGLAPLRAAIHWLIKHRKKVRHISLLYGAKTPSQLLYREEFTQWEKEGIKVVLTVDSPEDGWTANIGVVTTLWHHIDVDFKRAVAYICGPPVMINASMLDLYRFGMPLSNIITTLEAHMKCGVGKCGHCYASEKYICTDGPVFSYEEIKRYRLL
jgi:sulfite reductase subunit B